MPNIRNLAGQTKLNQWISKPNNEIAGLHSKLKLQHLFDESALCSNDYLQVTTCKCKSYPGNEQLKSNLPTLYSSHYCLIVTTIPSKPFSDQMNKIPTLNCFST
jgi:hypothetical protein